MAKFYLHMEPGDILGKVTKLKYIDDVSDDELTIYVFEDNTKCDETYIAEINNMDAFNGRFIMTELSEPTNKWTFVKKEFNLDATRKVVGADGVTYELPDAGIGRNGEHISLSFTEEGTPIAKSISNAGKRTDAQPPRISKNKNIEPKENYLLSLHPELLTGDTSVLSEKKITSLTSVLDTPAVEQPVTKAPENKTSVSSVQKILSSPISTNVVETVKHASININVDDIINNEEYESISLTIKGETLTLTPDEFAARLLNEVSTNKDTEISPYEDPEYKEDILIKNMIDKSKKKVYTIGIDVEMELPPKEVYKTIKDVYPEGMDQHFVTCIARRMNGVTLKESVAHGLTAYYEASIEPKKSINNTKPLNS